jgi:murein DD-endopeptidase MepM/ murein hydrolase activator NlpD
LFLPLHALVVNVEYWHSDEMKWMSLVLHHELIHLKNQDPLIILIGQVLTSLAWFNPLIKRFNQQLIWSIETSCDQEVLNNKPNLRRIYAQAMLQILRDSASKKSKFLIAAFSMKTHRSLTMRINNIMNPMNLEYKSKPKKYRLWGTAIVFGAISAIAQPQLDTSQKMQEFKSPMKNVDITSNYGYRAKFKEFHRGIDLRGQIGTSIYSVNDGVIIESTDLLKGKKGYGTIVIIDHGDGLHSLYSHLNQRAVEVGDNVVAGQEIGFVGETGLATGPHLHLEILKNNQHQNPSDYIQFN